MYKKQSDNEVIMGTPRRKYVLCLLLLGVCLCCIPTLSKAIVGIQAQVVSGYITKLNMDHSVTLDNNKTYIPSRGSLIIDLPVGAAVTLEYYINNGNMNTFFEYAPGLNSLQINTPNTTGNK